MGNSASVNNVSLLDQRRYQSEFLRYSQIPYDGKYQHQSNQNFDVNQSNHKDSQQSMMNAMKVLPEIKLEPKLKVTNNGAILSAGGTISGQKTSGSNLHRSKSISEAQSPHPVVNKDVSSLPPPQFKMSRASTQLSINLQKSSMGNSKKIYNSSYNLNNLDLREKAERDERKQKKVESFINGQKKSKPLVAPSNPRNFNDNKIKKVPPPPNANPPAPPVENSSRSATRMFGDTLKNSRSSTKTNFKSAIDMKKQSERPSKVSALKIAPPSSEISIGPVQNRMKVNPVSYLRREKTFDLSLMQTPSKEKFKVHLSPQLEHRNFRNVPKVPSANLTQPERFARHTSYQSYKNPPNVCRNESPTVQKIDALKRISVPSKPLVPRVLTQVPKDSPTKPVKREPSLTGKCKIEKKTSINSAISNPTVSANSSFKFSAPLLENSEVLPTSLQIEINNESLQQADQDIVENLNMNNFYFGMNEACVDSEDDERNDIDSTSLSAINLFAENIFKMNSNNVESRTDNTSSQDSSVENGFDTSLHDISLNLRPTLPRRQLEIPRFSPVAAWKSLSIESNLMDSHSKDICISFLNISEESSKQETEIERVYREPSSFNMYQLDAKSGDSGISADKEEVCNGMNNSPTSQLPQSYLMASWTPQQDLEGDEEESIDGNVKENFHQSKEDEKLQHFPVAPSGHMFSLSLPRDNQYISSDSCGLIQNNFYTLQKFRKSLVEVFSTDVVDGKTHFVGDGNWLLSSQPNSIDDLRIRRETENQVILQNHEKPSRDQGEQNFSSKSKSKYKFKFQSTIRQTERKKIAEKLSREAEKKEMHRIGELEAMQKVEEEFQRKRAREKNFIQQQLRIASMEEEEEEHEHRMFLRNNNNRSKQYAQNYEIDSDDEVDTRTPYIYKIIEAKSSKSTQNK